MDADLDRLQHDLGTLRSATGLAPVWTRDSVRTHWLLAAAGAVAAVWALVPHGLWPVAGLTAFAVPAANWWWQSRGRPHRTAANEREWQEAMAVGWYAAPLALLAIWSRAIGLELMTLAGLMCFMLGLVLFGPAVSERGMRPLLAWAVALMFGGLLMPLGIVPPVPVLAAAIAAGAAAAVPWITVEIRRTTAT
jgi:hypothetical protein